MEIKCILGASSVADLFHFDVDPFPRIRFAEKTDPDPDPT